MRSDARQDVGDDGRSRTLRCSDCEGPDPIKSPYATWLACR